MGSRDRPVTAAERVNGWRPLDEIRCRTWVEPRGMTPAPQGAGVFASDDWREVIEMTDDDTGTIRARRYANHSITLEAKWSALGARSPRGAGDEED